LRGLILMSVDRDDDSPAKGTITARLIDGSRSLSKAVAASIERYKDRPKPHDDFDHCMVMHEGHHKHQGAIQVFDGTNDEAGLQSLAPGEDIDIVIDARNKNYVRTEPSYDKFMPKLRKIAANAKLPGPGEPNSDFVSHTVRINRGVIRVRDVGDWDAGSTTIPAKYREPQDHEAVFQPAKVRFLNANVFGYVATECVIDIDDAKSVTIGEPGQSGRTYTGQSMPSRRAAEDTVEILITNFAPQPSIALPWTLHYRWMFEAAGYNVPIPLGGAELDQLKAFGTDYDRETWVCESEMFLDPNETGYPFPYRLPAMWSVRLGDLDYSAQFNIQSELRPDESRLVLADPGDPVRCPMGDGSK
jgi:hypothetical protein